MKTRKQKAREAQLKQLPKRHPHCGFLKPDMLKRGIEVQTWGLGPNNELVYAGVHYVPEINAANLYRLHKHWANWRKWYDNLPEHRHGDYPAKHNPQVMFTGAHPIDAPKEIRWLKLV